jgi:effector-binding domain-containing protein
MLDWISQQGYDTAGPAYQIIQLDISVTDRIETEIIEIQIPVKKKT